MPWGEAEPSVVGRPDPAAGGGFTYALPFSERSLVAAVTFQLVTAAAAASRIVYLDLLDSGGVRIGRFSPGLNQTATHTTVYTFAVGLNAYGVADAASMGAPLPFLPLPDGCTVSVGITAVQAADQISGIRLTVLQAPVRDDDDS